MVDKTPPPDELDPRAGRSVESALPVDDAAPFEILAKRRRRYALLSLMDAPDGVATLDDLADDVVALERAADAEVPDDHRERVVTDLYHVDLPKLVEAGVAEYDARSRTARYHGGGVQEDVLALLADRGGR